MKGITRFWSICFSLLLVVSTISGCSKPTPTSTPTPTTTTAVEESATPQPTEAPKNYWDLLDSVSDTSDLPDWNGKQLKLSMWWGHGPGDANHPVAEKDVVTPEVKRVTGVEIDRENSFDNGGSAIDVKMGMLAAAKDWPDLIYQTGTTEIKQLVESGALYDLTELIPQYCPNIMKKFMTEKDGKLQGMTSNITRSITANVSDKIYFVPTAANWKMTQDAAMKLPDFDRQRWGNVIPPEAPNGWPRIYIRDDLLKKLYPNAMTQDEIEAAYLKSGTFTPEQLYDIPVKSGEDFYKLLKDLKDLIDREGITEDGKPVEVTYANNGGDNWQVMSCLLPQVTGDLPNYLTYYDKAAGKVVYAFQQGWFKKNVFDYWKLVKDGVVSKESLIDSDVIFAEKVNSGHYAITFAWTKPDEEALKKAGKTYRYRYLWPNVQYKYNEFPQISGEAGSGVHMGIFKDKVAAEDVPQILRWLDYMCSDVGTNLHYWGPKSAGLFTEENGVRKYTEKDLEDNMVYAKDNGKNVYYNLYNYKMPQICAWPRYPVWSDEDWMSPRYTYAERVRSASEASVAFNPGFLPGNSSQENQVEGISSGYMPEYADQWSIVGKGRQAFEDALEKTLAASSEAEFESLWKQMLDTATSIGMNDDMLNQINTIFMEKNKGYMEGINKSK